MTRNRADMMVERLRNMQAAAPDIEASAVVSVDGLIMASALQQGVEEDRVSAMSAAMLSLGERISNELGRAGLEQVYIKGDRGSIVLTSIGDEAVLTAMARHEAKLGMIFLEMRRAAEDLVKLVGRRPRFTRHSQRTEFPVGRAQLPSPSLLYISQYKFLSPLPLSIRRGVMY
jgi:predicted regulator of Ras-like GTPase activity (Roadblock/LC7/MglB family)